MIGAQHILNIKAEDEQRNQTINQFCMDTITPSNLHITINSILI